MRGFLLIDKDAGMTSFDVVHAVRKLSGEKKVGHAGTLDPLATGLLLVAVGEATKLLEYLVGCDKEYEVMAKFGEISDTYDADGKIEFVSDEVFSKSDVSHLIEQNFLGKIEQVPPKYSAIKLKGKKAYELARQGVEFEIKAREVTIKKFEFVNFDWPFATFRIACSSGTYIRSLIHDLGQKLGCGAYVTELRRTKIDDFSVKDAVKLEVLSKNFEQYFLPVEKMPGKFDVLSLTDADFEALKDGKVLLGKKVEQRGCVLAIYKGKVLGVLENVDTGIKYAKVLH